MCSPSPTSKQKRLDDDNHGVHLPGSVSDDTSYGDCDVAGARCTARFEVTTHSPSDERSASGRSD
jgi:hypothetical protein